MSIYPPDMKPVPPLRRETKTMFYGKRDVFYIGVIVFLLVMIFIIHRQLQKEKVEYDLYVKERSAFHKKQLQSAANIAETSLKLMNSNNDTYLGLIEVVRISVRNNKDQMTEKATGNILAIVAMFESQRKEGMLQAAAAVQELEQTIEKLKERNTK